MSPTETKSKVRPQQSCLKCRERKIKCDRNIPCEACIHRGIESECTYLTSAEDRAHISQAEIIDRLRREVVQLRSQLNQSSSSARGPSPGRRDRAYARKSKTAGFQRGSYTATATAGIGSSSGPGSSGSRSGPGSRSATGSAEPMDGGSSWPGSSPSSMSPTNRTNSVTVTSPDSTGSESGVGGAGHVQQYVYSGSTGPYGPQIAEVDMAAATDSAAMGNYLHDDRLAQCHTDSLPAFTPKIPDSISMQGLSSQNMHPAPGEALAGLPQMHMYSSRGNPSYDGGPAHAQPSTHLASPGHIAGYDHNLHGYTNTSHMTNHNFSQTYPQPWSHGHHFPHPYPNTTPAYDSSSMNTFTPTDSTIYPHSHSHSHHTTTTAPTQTQPYSPPTHPTESKSHAINSIPDSWKGPDKQALLETLLETITSCDEARVAQVVAVVRNSETPEEAVSGICQVLGISGNGNGAGRSLTR